MDGKAKLRASALFVTASIALSVSCRPAPSSPVTPSRVHNNSPQENLLQNAGFEENWFNKNFAEQRRFLLLQASDAGMAETDGHIDYWTVREGYSAALLDRENRHRGHQSVLFSKP